MNDNEMVIGQSRPPREGALNILVVDDEEAICFLVTAMIRHGYPKSKSTGVYSLAEALDFLDHNPVDLVVTDFNIPVGNEGAVIARKTRELWPKAKVIVMSGNVDDAREKCGEMADGYLAKSTMGVVTILETVSNVL
jgi:two-component system response regulator YesN